MATIDADDPLVSAVEQAIHSGDLAALTRFLSEHPGLATARIGDDDPVGMSRTLLHAATDWPGHYPNGPQAVRALVEAGADVNARFRGPHTETPLHWAASSNDVPVLDALLDAGAEIDAPGAVIGNGTPLSDARAFGNWDAAFRLVERGATVTLIDAAGLGLIERVRAACRTGSRPEPSQLNAALWSACAGGRQECAEYLVERGAELNWVPPWEPLTPLDAARRSETPGLADWLLARGARSAQDLPA